MLPGSRIAAFSSAAAGTDAIGAAANSEAAIAPRQAQPSLNAVIEPSFLLRTSLLTLSACATSKPGWLVRQLRRQGGNRVSNAHDRRDRRFARRALMLRSARHKDRRVPGHRGDDCAQRRPRVPF